MFSNGGVLIFNPCKSAGDLIGRILLVNCLNPEWDHPNNFNPLSSVKDAI